MLVSEFIKIWDETKVETAKKKLVSDHIVRKYVPVLEKNAVLQETIKLSTVKDSVGNEYIDMVKNKIAQMTAIVLLYTDLEPDKIDDKIDMPRLYDGLVEKDIDKVIINNIGDDIAELVFITEQILDTWHLKNSSIRGYINEKVKNIGDIVNKLGESFGDSLKNLDINELVKNATPETLEKFKDIIK